MADAFRGLTLRLGADATPVNRAINSITKSAGAAQKQLNKMEKALKFDSTNAAALASRIDIADDKARHMASALKVARDAIKQAGKESVRFSEQSGIASGKLKDVSASVKDAYSQTQKLRQGFTGVNSALQHVNEAMAKVYEKQNKVDNSKAIKEVLKLRQAAAGTGEKAEKAREDIKALLTAVAGGGTGQNRFKDLEGDATALIGKYDKLRAEQKRFQSDLEAMESVEGFRALTYGEIEYESALREAVAETVRFKAEAASVKNVAGFKEAAMAARSLDTAVEEATNNMRVMNAAYDKLPASVETARNKMLATRDAQQALTQQAKHLEDAIKAIQNSPGFEKLADGTKNVHLEFARASEAATKAGADFKDAQAKVKAFEDELLDAKTSMNGLSEGGRGVDEINSDLMKANQELREMEANAREADAALEKAASHRDLATLKTQLADVNTMLAEIKSRSSVLTTFGHLGKGLREFGFGAYASITPAITMAGRYAIQAAEDIDASYRDMRKTVNGTEEDFESLKNAALEFSTTHVTSASQILDIEAIGGQLGIAVDDLEAFSHTVSNLDIATNMETEDIALSLAKLSNIMHFTSDEYDSFADSLVRLGNNEPALESDIMKISTRFAGMAANVNMTTADMLGLATAATATGQKAEAAGSSMQRTISRIEGAVASGGDALDEYARISGVTAEEFAAQWKDRPAVAIQQFVEGLKSIKAEGGSVDQTLVGLGITGVRDKQLLAGLTNTTDVLAESLGMANDAWNGMSTDLGARGIEQAGDAMREAERKSEGFSGELGKMRNQAMYLANAMADGAAPIIHDLGNLFGQLAQAVGQMPDEMKTNIVMFAGLAAAAGPVAVGLGTVLTSVTQIAAAFSAITKGALLTKFASSVMGPTTAMKSLYDTFPKVAMGLSRLKGGFMTAIQAAAPFAPAIAVAGGAIAYLVTSIADENAKIQMHNSTVEGLGSVVERTAPKVGVLASDLSSLGLSAEKTTYNLEDVTRANADMLSSIEERNTTAQAEISSLEQARLAIVRYGNAGRNLSGEEQAKLVAAVDLVNQKCGTQFQILDQLTGKLGDESGKYVENVSAIGKYISEKQRLIQVEALEADLADLNAQKRETMAAFYSADDQVEAEKYYKQWKSIESAIEGTEKMLAGAASEADGMNVSVGESVTLLDEWSAAFEGIYNKQAEGTTSWKSYQEALVSFGDALDQTGIGVEKFSDMSDEMRGTMVRTFIQTGGDIEAALAAVGLEATSLGEQLRNAFEGNDEGLAALEQRVAEFPGGMEAFAQSLVDAGTSVSDFAAMGSERFDALYTAAEGDLNNLILIISSLNSQGIDPKEVKIDGNQVTDVNGRVFELQKAVDNVGARTYTLTLVSDPAPAQEGVEEAEAAGEDYDEETYEADAEMDSSGAEQGAADAEAAGLGYDGNVYTSYADLDTSKAYSALSELRGELQRYANETYTATAKADKQAHGGIFNGGTLRAYKTGALFPRHADGGMNGIVTRATMTNVGWVGEAGTEAVFHMRHAGGAIVPLSNRRYVRPFARAVASEMGGGSTRNVNVTVNLDYKAGDDANKMARDISRRINAYMNMEA